MLLFTHALAGGYGSAANAAMSAMPGIFALAIWPGFRVFLGAPCRTFRYHHRQRQPQSWRVFIMLIDEPDRRRGYLCCQPNGGRVHQPCVVLRNSS